MNDLTGQRFGRLVVLNYAGSNKRRALWKCVCDCGNEVIVTTSRLTTGNTRSCGCLKRIGHTPANKTHGKKHTRLYHIWTTMKQRCFNINATSYDIYGERGITICEEWASDFQAFYDWAMANGYRDNLTIDRINVNGNYEPSNCRWATPKQQSNNQRTNHLITYKGETKTIAEFAEEYNMKYVTLHHRLKYGWSIEKALTQEVRKCKKS